MNHLGAAASALAALWYCLSVTTPAVASRAEDGATAVEMATFQAWLDSARAGYGCDEGPARFGNKTVESSLPPRTPGSQPPQC